MLREEEERYQVETRISRLFWMSLALVPLWLSRQEVSWSSAPWTQSVPVVKTWRGRRKRKGYPQGRWNTVGRKRLHHVSDWLFLCLILLSCPASHHVLCSSFSPLVVPCVSFPYPPFASCPSVYLSTYPSSRASEGWWLSTTFSIAERPLLHQVTTCTVFFSPPLCLHSHHFSLFGRVIILLWTT